IHALMNLVTTSREQETRRRDLEVFTSQIESAISQEDFKTANEKAEQGLKKFPSDPTLLKLKAVAEKQMEAGENKKFIDEQDGLARKLMDEGKAADALELLERANQKVRGDSRLRSLITIVRESADKEKATQRKTEYLQKAKAAIERKDYEEAVTMLETAKAELTESAEINDLLEFAHQEAISQRKARAFDDANKAMAEDDYDQAISVLEKATKEFQEDDLKLLLAEAQGKREQFQRKVEAAISGAQRMLDAKKFQEALAFLESQPKSYQRS